MDGYQSPCYGHGGPQCSPPYPFACPDCGRRADPPIHRPGYVPLRGPQTLDELLDAEAARLTHNLRRYFSQP